MRFSDSFQAENVCAGAAEDKVNSDVAAKVFLKELYRPRRERIVAVSDNVAVVSGTDSLDHLRMNTGVIVTGEAAFAHNIGLQINAGNADLNCNPRQSAFIRG